MGAAATFSFLGAALAGAIALVALFRAKKHLAHWPFALGMAILAVESTCAGLAVSAVHPEDMLRLQQLRLLVVSLLPGTWLIFSLTYARGNAGGILLRRRVELFLACAVPVAIAVLFRSKLIVLVERGPAAAQWALGLGWSGMAVYALVLMGSILILMNLERTLRAAVGTMRWRIKFMLLGVGLLFIVRIYTSSEALLFRGIALPTEFLNSVAMIASALIIVRSFFRTGNFDADVYPSQLVLQNSITVLVGGVYLVLVGLFAKVASYLGGDSAFALEAFLGLVSLVLLVVLLQSDRARLRLSRFVSRNFQRPQHDYRTVWLKFTEGTADRAEPKDLCRSLVRMTADVFSALSVAIWLISEETEGMSLGASTFLSEEAGRSPGLRQADTELVVRHFLGNPEPLDIDRDTARWAEAIREIHPSQFPNGGHRVCMPLISQGSVIGLLTLGDRVGGERLTLQDFDMLRCISDHSSACLANAQLSRKLLQSKELESFQTMATFFVHDLKNAAATLNLMLQNLPEHFNDPQFREDSLRGVAKTVTHIDRLIGRLGTFRHDQPINPQPTDLNAVVTDAVGPLEAGTGTMLSKDLGELPRIPLDREQMLKVVTNLVLNATEASPPDGKVRISTATEPNWTTLTVADDGCGMSHEFLRHQLFRPFKTTKKTGLGIGMFQSKMIVEAHGGRIAVASEPGKGTTFRVFLPSVRPMP